MSKTKKKPATIQRQERLEPIYQALKTLSSTDMRATKRFLVALLKETTNKELLERKQLCQSKFPPGTAVTYNTRKWDQTTSKYVRVPEIGTIHLDQSTSFYDTWVKLLVKNLADGNVRYVKVALLKTHSDLKQ